MRSILVGIFVGFRLPLFIADDFQFRELTSHDRCYKFDHSSPNLASYLFLLLHESIICFSVYDNRKSYFTLLPVVSTERFKIASEIFKNHTPRASPSRPCAPLPLAPHMCSYAPFTKANDGDIWYNNTITGDSFRSYCTLCPATYACNATGLAEPDTMCAEGYFCKLGASSPTPYCEAGEKLCDYGVCPQGHYCLKGVSDPQTCPPGNRERESCSEKLGWRAPLDINH